MVMTEVMLLVRMPFIRVVGMRSSAGLIDRTNEEEEEEEEEGNDDEKGRGGEYVEWENDEVDGIVFKEEEGGGDSATNDDDNDDDDDKEQGMDVIKASRNFEFIHNLGIFWNASFSNEGEK